MEVENGSIIPPQMWERKNWVAVSHEQDPTLTLTVRKLKPIGSMGLADDPFLFGQKAVPIKQKYLTTTMCLETPGSLAPSLPITMFFCYASGFQVDTPPIPMAPLIIILAGPSMSRSFPINIRCRISVEDKFPEMRWKSFPRTGFGGTGGGIWRQQC